jgi:hypothetical protein
MCEAQQTASIQTAKKMWPAFPGAKLLVQRRPKSDSDLA